MIDRLFQKVKRIRTSFEFWSKALAGPLACYKMYRVTIFDCYTKVLQREVIEKFLHKVVEISNARLKEIRASPKPNSYYLSLQNNQLTCVAPGIYVTRMECEPPPLFIPQEIKSEQDIDILDALRSIHIHFSILQHYRDNIGGCRGITQEVLDYTNMIDKLLRSCQGVVDRCPWLVQEYATTKY
jgi:hypothetical protein